MDSATRTTDHRSWRARPVLKALTAIALLLVLALGAFLIWALTPYRADETALAALESGNGVTVSKRPEGIIFEPDTTPSTGLVLYPGGRVEAAAYAPLARGVAAEGYLVVVQPMPLNLAVLGIGRASDAIEAYPAIRTWAVGGHSLGGAMSSEFVARQTGSVSALVLLAAYPASSDLSGAEIHALTMRGSEDGLVSPEEVADGQLKLPPGSTVYEIEGGNHAGFGSYGEQRGDGATTLPEGAQMRLAAEAIADLLSQIAE